MLIDTTIIYQAAGMTVIEAGQVVLWPVGSTIALHRVRQHDIDSTFLRAFRTGARWIVIDLRAMARSLAVDLIELPARDTDGLVLYTLRREYPNAAAFVQRALQHDALHSVSMPQLSPA